MTFESFSLDRRILSAVREAGYQAPTPIQTRAIPPVLEGHDVMGLAQTGTGKTAAFALPILQRLLNADAPGRGPVRVLVLAPTRELALQIHQTFVDMGRQTGIRSAAVFGGVGMHPQVKALRQSTVVVACPGRLLDLLNQGLCDLSAVDTLVLDEADRMLDMGFMPDIKRILARLPKERQNLLFSATMPSDIRALAADILRRPVEVQVANTAPAAGVRQTLYAVAPGSKTALLEALLAKDEHEAVLIFTRTKHRAKSLAQSLGRKGWKTTFLQGNLSQSRRTEALDGFKSGKYNIMVATDIAARGIDCACITHVINYDLPDTAENYTHRIGRTGRAERTGEALTLATSEDAQAVRMIERAIGKTIERVSLEGFVPPAVADDAMADRRPAPRRGQPRGQGRGQRSGQNHSQAQGGKTPGNGGNAKAAPDAGRSTRQEQGNKPSLPAFLQPDSRRKAGGRGARHGRPDRDAR